MSLIDHYTVTSMARRRAAREIARSERLIQQITLVAGKLGRTPESVAEEVQTALNEIVTVQAPAFGLMFDFVLGPMHTRAWTVDADLPALRRLKKLNEKYSLVFLPTHRSYADAFILSRLLRDNGLKRNHILGGNNLGFWPMGTIIRRSGGVLIRRSFQNDEVYKMVVREYLGYLASKRNNLEWYMEGGRSRTGKLRPPKYGLLRYLVDAIESGGADDMLLVPVSTTYDQMHEVATMAAEEAGAPKAKENLSWLAGYARRQQKWIGTAYTRFGEPLSLREALQTMDSEGAGKWTVAKIAFEVFQRINRVTPVTAPALMTLALLGVRDRALTLAEVHELVVPLLEYAKARGLPCSPLDSLYHAASVRDTLDTLIDGGVVSRYDEGMEPVYRIEPGQHAVAAFYRNSAIHWFVNRAIMELSALDVSRVSAEDPIEHAWQSAMNLRDLLKFEFFFSDKAIYREEMRAESRLLDPEFLTHMLTPEARHAMLMQSPFLIAHRVLRPFVEAYYIVADRLAAHPVTKPVDKKTLIEQCVTVGRQYLLQQRLRNPECVSREIFGNALALASNRDLLKPGKGVAKARAAWLEEMTLVVKQVAAIDEFDQQRHDAGRPATESIGVEVSA